MNIGLDRDEWIEFKRVSETESLAILSAFMPPGSIWAHTEEELREWPGMRQPKQQDIDLANSLLDDVFGAGQRFSTSCMTSNRQMYVDGCLFFKDQMEKHYDISVAMDINEAAVNTAKGNAGDFDMAYGSTLASYTGDPDSWFSYSIPRETLSTGRVKAVGEPGFAQDPVLYTALEDMVAAQSRELDVEKRIAMVKAIDWKLYDEAAYYIPYGWTIIYPAYSPDLRGWKLFPMPSQTKWVMWERAWLVTE